MCSGNSAILKKLQDAGKEPHLHDEWIAEWRELYEQLEVSPDSSSDFAQIEHAALGSLSNVKVHETFAHLNVEVCRMLDRFNHPALLVEANGNIIARNAMLQSSFELNSGDNIADLPIKLSQAESLQDVIHKTLASGFSDDGAQFKSAHSNSSSHEYTLAITKSTGAYSTAALVFIVSPRFSAGVTSLVKEQYDLTTAECEILDHFVKGYSLKEISSIRCRSYATVRTQFSSLMSKMGAHSQASLLRTAFSLSDFATEIDKFSDVLEHPYRANTLTMRPAGRTVEVCFCGDPSGTAMLHIPHASMHQLNASVEEQLFKAAIYLVTVSPPGYGKSDPPSLEGDDKEKIWIDDVKAVLELLGIERCPVLATSAGTYRAFRLARFLPNYISRVVLLAACPPGRYWIKHGTDAPWIDGSMRVSENHPTLRRLLVSAGIKAWVAIGSEKFHRLQLAKNRHDIAVLTRPENSCEFEQALASASRQGLTHFVEDICSLLQDYNDTIRGSACGISIVHGAGDTNLSHQGMIDFQNDFPDRVQLTTIENGGFTLLLSHTAEVCKILRSLLDQDSIQQPENLLSQA